MWRTPASTAPATSVKISSRERWPVARTMSWRAITLNRAVGGLNALAVEIAAREGARTVWFPTVNSVNEQHEVHPPPPGSRAPVWVAFELDIADLALDDVGRDVHVHVEAAADEGAGAIARLGLLAHRAHAGGSVTGR